MPISLKRWAGTEGELLPKHYYEFSRLVSSGGDGVWSTTQESKGAKYKTASADVADKIVKQLIRDMEKAQLPKP